LKAIAYIYGFLFFRGYLDQTILVGDGSVIDNSKQQCIKCREAAFKTNMSAYSFSNEISSPFRSSRIKRESSQGVLEDGSLDKAAVYTGLLEVLGMFILATNAHS
jgi:hypothetical protein